jgi:hypothetical protein
MRHLWLRYPDMVQDRKMPSGFNPTLGGGPHGWNSQGCFGLDQGIIVLMIENYRSKMIWKLMRECAYIGNGLRRAGFTGGWLQQRSLLLA